MSGRLNQTKINKKKFFITLVSVLRVKWNHPRRENDKKRTWKRKFLRKQKREEKKKQERLAGSMKNRYPFRSFKSVSKWQRNQSNWETDISSLTNKYIWWTLSAWQHRMLMNHVVRHCFLSILLVLCYSKINPKLNEITWRFATLWFQGS